MRHKWDRNEERYFAIGVYKPKTEENIGTLWRSAYILGADFIFIIGKKYKKQRTDTHKVWSKIPLFQFGTFESFYASMPYSCKLVGIELHDRAEEIKTYQHFERSMYLLGSEDNGPPKAVVSKCHDLIKLPGDSSLNVAVAGSLVLFDRINKDW